MPALLIGLAVIVLGVCSAVIYLLGTGRGGLLEGRGLDIATLVLSLVSLAISIKLFWNMGVYADEYGSSPVLVAGGWFWLRMDWVRLGLLLVLCVISGLRLIRRSQ